MRILGWYTTCMNTARSTGYRELEHTADWEIEVWAPDLPALLNQAAYAMYALTGTKLKDSPRITREIAVQAEDAESLLVGFLSELLYHAETDSIGFDEFELDLENHALRGRLGGAPVESQTKEIKAVTYHNLEIRRTERGLEANIVFDV